MGWLVFRTFPSTFATIMVYQSQALLLFLANGHRLSTLSIRGDSSFHFSPHPTNFLLPFFTLHHLPCPASLGLCKNSFWCSTAQAPRWWAPHVITGWPLNSFGCRRGTWRWPRFPVPNVTSGLPKNDHHCFSKKDSGKLAWAVGVIQPLRDAQVGWRWVVGKGRRQRNRGISWDWRDREDGRPSYIIYWAVALLETGRHFIAIFLILPIYTPKTHIFSKTPL